MQRKVISTLLAGAVAVSAQCTIPTDILPSTIPGPFRIQVQNITRPDVHDKYMNLFVAGGGDQHLFVGPVGNPTYDLELVNGVIEWKAGGVRAVIGGEFSDIDHTTKLFMTGRGDPRAIFAPTYACNPDNPTELQTELQFVGWQGQPAGGWICVRPTFDNAHEFRYYPPGNTLVDVNRECIKVTLVIRPTPGGAVSSTTTAADSSTTISAVSSTTTAADSSTTTSAAAASSTLSTSTTTTATSTTTSAASSSSTNVLYTDQTSQGFRFIGCSPEERRVNPPDFPARTLPSSLYAADTLTNEICMAYCSGLGYKYAGTEWSRECWCANAYAPTRQPPTTLASLALCNYRCRGDATQFCGGDAYLSLYEKCPVGGPCENAVFT